MMLMVWRPQPGDRVQVRVNAECQYCVDIRFPDCTAVALANDGRTATVYSVGHDDCHCQDMPEDPPDREHLAHDIWVRWDEEREYDDPVVWVGDWRVPFDQHFSAHELEPLEEGP